MSINNKNIKTYEVGGYVRDSILNITSNDKDYVAEAPSFAELKSYIENNNQKIFLERPEFGVIRYLNNSGVAEDISLAAKERDQEGKILKVGSVKEDLATRDFTMNAIARDREVGQLIDPFNGIEDINKGIIRSVEPPKIVFENDPARIIRAIRFKCQFKFKYSEDLSDYLYGSHEFSELKKIDRERLRQELEKCLKVSSLGTFEEIFKMNNNFKDLIFNHFKIQLLAR